MKLGFLGPLGGVLLAAIILGATVHYTPTDAPARLIGLGVALVVFLGAVALAIRGERK